MSFDLVYKEVGDFGLYQKYIILLCWLSSAYEGLIFITSVFLLYVPDHRCAIPGYPNDTYDVQDEAHYILINRTIPISSDGMYDKCNLIRPEFLADEVKVSNLTLVPCKNWVYDATTFTSTLGAKLNLVCSRTILKSSAQMVFFGGVLIGSFVTGIVSDRFGRKPTMSVSVILLLVAALSVAWTPSIEIYMFLSASVGCLCVGMFMPVFVTGMELVGPSKRMYAGQFGAPFWTIGNVLMTLIAYLIRDWSTFQIVCVAPGALFLIYLIIFPESPRWLFTQGRIKESKAIIEKAASVNKVILSEDLFDTLTPPTKSDSKVAFLRLFSSRVLATRALVLYVNWIAVCMAYYGLALNSDGLGSEKGIHLYFLLQSLMDIPAFLLVVSLIDRVGRRILLVTCMLIGGTACIATMFLTVYGGKDTSSATLALALVGKIGAACGFALLYQFSAELFPTVVRNAGMGSCSCMARIGGIMAPFVADLDRLVSGNFGKALPLLVFGCWSILAGVLSLLLPETMKRDLPETLQDGIHFGKRLIDSSYRYTDDRKNTSLLPEEKVIPSLNHRKNGII